MKLTDPEYENGISAATPLIRGMAYFSGTGPRGAVCNMCVHAVDAKLSSARKAKCQKAMDCAKGKAPAFPYESGACKYFERRLAPLFVTAANHFYGAK